MCDFKEGESRIGTYLNFSFARPVVKKSTFLRLRGLFEYEIQSWKYRISLFFTTQGCYCNFENECANVHQREGNTSETYKMQLIPLPTALVGSLNQADVHGWPARPSSG